MDSRPTRGSATRCICETSHVWQSCCPNRLSHVDVTAQDRNAQPATSSRFRHGRRRHCHPHPPSASLDVVASLADRRGNFVSLLACRPRCQVDTSQAAMLETPSWVRRPQPLLTTSPDPPAGPEGNHPSSIFDISGPQQPRTGWQRWHQSFQTASCIVKVASRHCLRRKSSAARLRAALSASDMTDG
ncbi:hypothetical protein BS50DRAFT_292084 [Corynespora cassiicola Philippines]|uniref:Uncharacterized protein n=1 Tax=Corynespora cassiicola Philippines TaxID=1448308 RepID=A0A2T2NWG5_CORCC|nr:hypothetical protein BS50DRAFT_292084 [Corynespora cassiicola Philippines]